MQPRHANRISCIRQCATIYAITTAIYRPQIHTNDTVRGTDGFPLSVLLPLPSTPAGKQFRSTGDTLRLTNNSHCRCGEFMIDERRRSRPALHTIETIGAGRRIRYIASGGRRGGPAGRGRPILGASSFPHDD